MCIMLICSRERYDVKCWVYRQVSRQPVYTSQAQILRRSFCQYISTPYGALQQYCRIVTQKKKPNQTLVNGRREQQYRPMECNASITGHAVNKCCDPESDNEAQRECSRALGGLRREPPDPPCWFSRPHEAYCRSWIGTPRML
jgi:hypothetical protein